MAAARARWVLLAVAVAAVATVAVLVLRDDDPAAVDAALDVDTAGLSSDAQALVALAGRAGDSRHHAVYEGSDGERIEVWVDGGRAREETTPPEGPRRLVLRTPEGTTVCTADDAEAPWACADPEPGGGGLHGQLEELVADLAGAPVTAEAATVADLAVTCFAVHDGEETVSVCLTDDGVVARLVAGTRRLELVELDHDVDEDRFADPDDAG